jgi:hypothetical protein
MRYENQSLTGMTIRLDDDEVVDCHLIDCQIIFGGKRQPVYSGNCALGCGFEFADSALITIEMLRRLLQVPSLRQMVLEELGLSGHTARAIH